VRRWAALAALALLAAGACGGATRPRGQGTARSARTVAAAVPTPKPAHRPKPRPRPNPGSLPQTNQLPSAQSEQFRAEMAALWSGVVRDSLRAALPAFFPEGAYEQVKAIADSGPSRRRRA
jgi:hypothetical protein